MWDQGAEGMLSSLCWFWKIGLVLAVIGGTVLIHEKAHDHERDRDQRSLLVNSHCSLCVMGGQVGPREGTRC